MGSQRENGFSPSQPRSAPESAVGGYEPSAARCCDDCAWACTGGCVLVRPDEQPYFQAYRFFCREPAEMRAGFDFMQWIGGRWGAWRQLRGLAPYSAISEEQRADFNAWLKSSVGIAA